MMILKRNADAAELAEGGSRFKKQMLIRNALPFRTKKTAASAEQRKLKELCNLEGIGFEEISYQAPQMRTENAASNPLATSQISQCHTQSIPVDDTRFDTTAAAQNYHAIREEPEMAPAPGSPDDIGTTAGMQTSHDGIPGPKPKGKASEKLYRNRVLTSNLETFVRRESQKPYLTAQREQMMRTRGFKDNKSDWLVMSGAQTRALCEKVPLEYILEDVLKSKFKKDRKMRRSIVFRGSRDHESITVRLEIDLSALSRHITSMFLDLAYSSWKVRSDGLCWLHGKTLQVCEATQSGYSKTGCVEDNTVTVAPIWTGADSYSITDTAVAELAKAWGFAPSKDIEMASGQHVRNRPAWTPTTKTTSRSLHISSSTPRLAHYEAMDMAPERQFRNLCPTIVMAC